MRNLLFADTSYWIALLPRRDQFHGKVLGISRSLSNTRIFPSEMVLTELLNGFSSDPQLRVAAASVVHTLRGNFDLTIVKQSRNNSPQPCNVTGKL